MKRLMTSILIFILGLAFGCVPFPERPSRVIPQPKVTLVPSLTSDFLDKRISSLDRILQEELPSKDKRIASSLLEAYKSIKRASVTHLTDDEYRDTIHSIFHILYLFDNCYFSIEQERPYGYSTKDVAEETTHDFEACPDLIHLKASIVELYLQQGQRQKALSVYKELTDALEENKAIIHSLSRKITATRGAEPEPPEDKGAVQAEGFTSQLLQEVKQLIQEHKFDEARYLLAQKRKQFKSAADLASIEDALNGLAQAEEEFINHRISMISRRENTLRLARRLIDEEKFEEAISNLDVLEVEQRYRHEIKELKEQAVEGLINRERNRAAKLFLTAKKTLDPLKKEEYLRSSYEILKSLAENYPSSKLNQKIKAHIRAVEEELDKL